MSGEGSPNAGGQSEPFDCHDVRAVVLAASWHAEIMEGLVDGALRALRDYQVADVPVVRVPGSFELPVAAAALARQGFEAVIALGVVVRGGTPHFKYVCSAATDGLSRVALDHGVAVGFGVLTCDTEMQARDRAGLRGSHENKGYEAAAAALVTATALRDLPRPAP